MTISFKGDSRLSKFAASVRGFKIKAIETQIEDNLTNNREPLIASRMRERRYSKSPPRLQSSKYSSKLCVFSEQLLLTVEQKIIQSVWKISLVRPSIRVIL